MRVTSRISSDGYDGLHAPKLSVYNQTDGSGKHLCGFHRAWSECNFNGAQSHWNADGTERIDVDLK